MSRTCGKGHTSNPMFDIHTLPGVDWPPSAATSAASVRDSAGCKVKHGEDRRQHAKDYTASWVETDDDAWAYLSANPKEAAHRFFFCKQQEDLSGRVPFPTYDLAVIGQAEAMRRQEYIALSARELVFIAHGKHTEVVPAAEYRRLKAAFCALRRIPFFQNYHSAKHFKAWLLTAKRLRSNRARVRLKHELLRTRPVFSEALCEAQALLHRLTLVDACGLASQHCTSLAGFSQQLAAWRRDSTDPAVSELHTALVRVAEAACSAAEEAAAAAQASIKDPSELTDRVGVNLYASTTAARAQAMVLIKQEKIDKANLYHEAVASATVLPRFVRLLDLLLSEALASMVANSCGAALAVLRQLPATTTSSPSTAEGGLLVSTVSFKEDDMLQPSLEPGAADWADALVEQLVEGSLTMAAVPALTSLPAFKKYVLPGIMHAPAEAVAHASPAVLASRAEFNQIVQDGYALAAEVVQQFVPQGRVQAFLSTSWNGKAWAAEQRDHLDLSRAKDDLGRLRGWQAELAAMPAGVSAGVVYLDASQLRVQIEPLLEAAVEQVVAVMLERGREACREQVEELGRRLQVLAARPTNADDYAGWAFSVVKVADERDAALAAVGEVNAVYEVLAQAGVKATTADAVRLDDLHDEVARLDPELAAAQAHIAEERPRQLAALAAAVTALRNEAWVQEDTLKHAYVDPLVPPTQVLADLDLLAAAVTQMQTTAVNIRGLQTALGVEESAFTEVAAVQREQQRLVVTWTLLSDVTELANAWLSGPTQDDSYSTRREGGGGDSRESELLPLEDRLAQLQRMGLSDPVLDAIDMRIEKCKLLCTDSVADFRRRN